MHKLLLRVTCLLMLCAAAVLWAQSTGTLSGKINAPGGAPAPNAEITVTNVNTNASQKVLTGADGSFSIALPPGTYRVDVVTAGFKRTTQHNIELNTTAAVNIVLEAGNTNETVEIQGTSPVTQDDNGEVGVG